MVIDFHVHPLRWQGGSASLNELLSEFWTAAELQTMVESCATGESFAQFLRAQGVDHAVILAENTPTTGIFNNEDVLALCRGVNGLIPFGTVFPGLSPDLARYAEDLVARGMRGFKLYPTYNLFYTNDRVLYPLYAKAQELGVPIMVHTGSSVFTGSRMKYGDPLTLDDVAVDFPRLKIVVSHAGRPFWFDHAEFLARYHENVYLDLAGLPPKNLLSYLPNLHRLTSKVVFGSDWPGAPSIASNLQAMRDLPLPAEALERILGANAARILGVAQPGSD